MRGHLNAVQTIERELTRIGYSPKAVIRDYRFADFIVEDAVERRVALAAFTQTPTSYRNAAAGVVNAEGRSIVQINRECLSLGAPLLFVVEGDSVTAWQVRTDLPPRQLGVVAQTDIHVLFARHADTWNPTALHRAKSIGAVNTAYQLDFVDVGLLPLIEGHVHKKLDRLLQNVLKTLIPRTQNGRSDRFLFRTLFRLLAAKILRDRDHELAKTWDDDDAENVLRTITTYYRLDEPGLLQFAIDRPEIVDAWNELRHALNFRNISADDLAYVYENTLVTPDVRKTLGTHSTPRQVAEYIVSRLEFWRHDPAQINVYEPFVGAGVFLVAALRHLRDLLPGDWSDRKRHNFLVSRLAGDDVDSFAVEVAKLSLILADYPNANGWRVGEIDLFATNTLAPRLAQANVIVCNPPFEQFSGGERDRYRVAAGAGIYTKAAAVLRAALDAEPLAIGFVLPEPFILGDQYEPERRRIEAAYRNIEVVRLPDRVFSASVVRSSLLIATGRRDATDTPVVRSTVVRDRDRERFLEAGYVSSTRVRTKSTDTNGNLWNDELEELWDYLDSRTRLGPYIHAHRGLEWNYPQQEAFSNRRQPGFARGIFSARSIRQFVISADGWLDKRPESAKYEAYKLPWDHPKILLNAARLSRGPWCAAAAVDERSFVASQQVFGVWLRESAPISLPIVAAIINSPIGNAFLASHSLPDRIRKSTLEQLPIPDAIPPSLANLVQEYRALLQEPMILTVDPRPADLLFKIDAAVLAAYDLPPRLERQLLEYFRGSQRPVLHQWDHWLPEGLNAAVPLSELVSRNYTKLTGDWLLRVCRPLSNDELGTFREVMD
jgi:hypothetical protein